MLSLLLITSMIMAQELPEDAKKALQSLEGQKLQLSLVFHQAIKASDSYKELAAQKKATDLPILYDKSKYDWQTQISISETSDKLEQAASTLPSNIRSQNYNLGINKYASSGTTFSLDISHGSQMFEVIGTTVPEFFDSKAELLISQNLLKDSFGYASRKLREAANIESLAKEKEYEKNFQNWSKNISELYYMAWLSKAQVETAKKSSALKKRLLDVSKKKLNRGTTEKPDFLQIEASYWRAKTLQNNAEKDLQDAWQRLVILAQLPTEWLDINALEVPIALDDPSPVSSKLCEDTKNNMENHLVSELSLKSKAAKQKRLALENQVYPDLKLNAAYAVNGIDNKATESIEEASKRDHEKWFVGLSLAYPLSNSKAKAELLSAKVQEEIAEAKKRSAISNLEADWLRKCNAYEVANKNYENAKKIYNKQSQRAHLEEERFRIGRANVFQVVQAGDDSAQAGFNLNRAEIERHNKAWEVIVLADEVKSYLDSLGVTY